jgi:hypothetical protein
MPDQDTLREALEEIVTFLDGYADDHPAYVFNNVRRMTVAALAALREQTSTPELAHYDDVDALIDEALAMPDCCSRTTCVAPTVHLLATLLRESREQTSTPDAETALREALARAGVPLEVLRAQIEIKPYAEMTSGFQDQIIEATEIVRAALRASSVDAEQGKEVDG